MVIERRRWRKYSEYRQGGVEPPTPTRRNANNFIFRVNTYWNPRLVPKTTKIIARQLSLLGKNAKFFTPLQMKLGTWRFTTLCFISSISSHYVTYQLLQKCNPISETLNLCSFIYTGWIWLYSSGRETWVFGR